MSNIKMANETEELN